jgi:hypothetical protein
LFTAASTIARDGPVAGLDRVDLSDEFARLVGRVGARADGEPQLAKQGADVAVRLQRRLLFVFDVGRGACEHDVARGDCAPVNRDVHAVGERRAR